MKENRAGRAHTAPPPPLRCRRPRSPAARPPGPLNANAPLQRWHGIAIRVGVEAHHPHRGGTGGTVGQGAARHRHRVEAAADHPHIRVGQVRRWDGGTARIHAAHRPTGPTRSGAARSSWRFTARSALPVRSRQARDTAAVGSPRASDITSTRGPRYLPSRKLDHPSLTMQARWTAPGSEKAVRLAVLGERSAKRQLRL